MKIKDLKPADSIFKSLEGFEYDETGIARFKNVDFRTIWRVARVRFGLVDYIFHEFFYENC